MGPQGPKQVQPVPLPLPALPPRMRGKGMGQTEWRQLPEAAIICHLLPSLWTPFPRMRNGWIQRRSVESNDEINCTLHLQIPPACYLDKEKGKEKLGGGTKRALDLFSGTNSVGKRLLEHGYEVTSLDILPQGQPTICCDILSGNTKRSTPWTFCNNSGIGTM